ncbi:MAG: hypothetical protein A2912_01315 [Candidatus Buchananbacteria bacterium RIFCSPLOWO2_01_FULL_40_23b]|uniref:Uncharacterized protein n=1 Tax=Candidatus Buchananbacteria bacterium RIFCSPLOWO2_01_FULL_40_23b TaxID=1797544 RepID=A0A1G1YTQ0_9BACT|nr:MAG: hypothetical protein A2912_01315 [Candidatus Buchananbacteria bacterium RIFCSPLOWO2_01_FULL_40_23b]
MDERTKRSDVTFGNELLENLVDLGARAYCVSLFKRKGLAVMVDDKYITEAIGYYSEKGRQDMVELLNRKNIPTRVAVPVPVAKFDSLEVLLAAKEYQNAAVKAAEMGRYLEVVSRAMMDGEYDTAKSLYTALLSKDEGQRKRMVVANNNGSVDNGATKSVVQLSVQQPELLEAVGKYQEAMNLYDKLGRVDEAVVVGVKNNLFLSAYTLYEQKKRFDMAAVVALYQGNERKADLYTRLHQLTV